MNVNELPQWNAHLLLDSAGVVHVAGDVEQLHVNQGCHVEE